MEDKITFEELYEAYILCLKNKNSSLFQAYILGPIYVFSINIIFELRKKIA